MPALFDIGTSRLNVDDATLINKTKKSKPVSNKKGTDLISKISEADAFINQYLGQYLEYMEVISDEQRLSEYIDHAISNGIIAIDTETTGLDPLVDIVVGVGVYTYDETWAYIPVEHISYVTGQRAKHQLESKLVGSILKRLEDAGTKIVMFNATFDIRMIKHSLGVRLHCWWDCYLAARLLNDNEPSNALKKLYQKYILRGESNAFTYEEIFKGMSFQNIPIKTAYPYAAYDPKITMDYCDYQQKYLYYEPSETTDSRNGMNGVAWVFFNIEMPCIDAVVDLEDTGIEFDFEYNEKLKEKYHTLLYNKEQEFHNICDEYKDAIDSYQGKVRFDNPVNINSVPQLQALLYDIIGLEGPIDKKTKEPSRSTGEEVLKKLKHPVADAILAYREFSTIVSTFIDKLPECVNKKDGRIHCKFNQYGADTGRFSSSDPNLQNIPSHNKDIRKMFKATDGYVIMSADYSQQEVKGMAQMCRDEGMIEAFKQGKDFYAEIASVAFGYPYDECLEFRPDGTTNPDGKERRAQAKSILLGINYGRGAASIAEQLGCSKQKAEKIKEDVFKGFPAIAEFERQSFEMAEELGYVTTLWGRKRRFPSMLLPDYEFEWSSVKFDDDPLDFSDEEEEVSEVPDELIDKWMRRIKQAWGKKRNQVLAQAQIEDGLRITDNTMSKDYTKIVNARIQGSAADMTKLAMIALQKDERLRELGFRMLIPIHDEILAECPVENVKECSERFAKIMSEAPGDRFEIPISCDVDISYRWYGDKYIVNEKGELEKLNG